MCSYWLRTWRHTCTLHLHTPFAYAIITKTSYAFFAKITLCIFYPMTPFAHAFAYAIKKTPYAFFAKITLCMYILCDIDLFFKSVILSKLTYGLSVYGACNAELNVVQSFLNRCFRRHYSSKLFDIYQLLEQSDKSLFLKARANVCHPLHSLLPKVKDSSLCLRQRTSQLPKINTERFKNSFCK